MYFYCVLLVTHIITSVPRFECITNHAGVKMKWPSRIIPYEIRMFSVKNKAKIESSLLEFEESLMVNGTKCLIFTHRKHHQKYFIKFTDSDDCSSDVGFIGSYNEISLNSSMCLHKSIIIHEVIHSLGWDHEHTRYDRDRHVFVNTDGLPEEYKSEFEINKWSNNLTVQDTPYDYDSIMHYSSNMFKNQSLSLKVPTLFGYNQIKRKQNLSQIDIIRVQRMYNCIQSPIQIIEPIEAKDYEIKMLLKSFKRKSNKSMLKYTHLSMFNRYNEMFVISYLFMQKANLLKISENITYNYLYRSFQTCGKSHYWPFEYPIVAHHHELYKTVCLEKKNENQSCTFSIECKPCNLCTKVNASSSICKHIKCPYSIII